MMKELVFMWSITNAFAFNDAIEVVLKGGQSYKCPMDTTTYTQDVIYCTSEGIKDRLPLCILSNGYNGTFEARIVDPKSTTVTLKKSFVQIEDAMELVKKLKEIGQCK